MLSGLVLFRALNPCPNGFSRGDNALSSIKAGQPAGNRPIWAFVLGTSALSSTNPYPNGSSRGDNALSSIKAGQLAENWPIWAFVLGASALSTNM
ncbi:hypothetical protein GCM10020370_49580 [Paenibacillus hodogayensis]